MSTEMQVGSDSEQFLTFRLGKEEFGVEICRVQGIQGWDSATQIPQTPSHVLGVIDLRGTVVPIIDLRRRLGFKNHGFSSTTVVIVVKANIASEEKIFGLVVDAVSEVRDVTREERKERPNFGTGVKAEYMLGLAASGDRMVILLDLDQLLNDSDVAEADELDEHGLDQTMDAPVSDEDDLTADVMAADDIEETDDPESDESRSAQLDVDALETSFALLEPRAEELVNRFYNSLFERYPAVQPMFENTSMRDQKIKLLAALKLVVENLRKPDVLGPMLERLGARHEELGAQPDHYEAVAETLLSVMGELAGDAWTPNLASTWAAALGAIAQGMLKGYSSEELSSAVA